VSALAERVLVAPYSPVQAGIRCRNLFEATGIYSRGRGYHYPTRPKKLIQHYPSFAADERKDNVEHEISEEMRRKNSTQNESRNDAAQTLPVMRQRKYH